MNIRGVSIRLYGASMMAIALAGATPASAADDAASTATVENVEQGTGDILVTARRRQETIQTTPISITAHSAASLEARGVTDLAGIEAITPGLTLRGNAPISGNPDAAVVFIRGVGQLDFSIFTDPGVGIYLDGVYVARSTGAVLDLVDIDRVEVLRGPQGTLFGRNTIGGAISIVSKRPAEEFGGSVNATTGSYNRVQLQGSVDIPLGPTLFSKFSGFIHKRDGYVKRLVTGQDLGDDNALAGRAQFLWKPDDSFSALLSVDGTRKREGGSPTVPIDLVGTGYVNLANGPAARPAAASNGSFAYLFNRLSATHPANPLCTTNPDASRDCFGAAWETNDPYATNGTYPAKARLDIFGTSLTLEKTLGWGTLRSISAYRRLHNDYGKDTDHTPYDLTRITYSDRQEQFSQEFNLSGRSFNRLDWLLGLYYFNETGNETFDNFNPIATTLADSHIDNSNFAAFGEATLDVTPWLHLTGGIRWTHETKRFRTDQLVGYQDPAIIAAFPSFGTLAGKRIVADNSWQKQTFNQWTPRATLTANLTPDAIVYATWSKGFKSGGFDGRYVPGFGATGFVLFDEPNRYDPEKLTLYEAGFKFASPDRRIRVNGALFRSDYRDLQVPYVPPGNIGVSYLSNAAKARIEGGEFEIALAPTPGLLLAYGASYTDARYLELDPARVPTIKITNSFPVTPKWTLNGTLSYAAPLDGHGTLTPRVDWSYRGRQVNDAENRPTSWQPGYHLFNASIAYDSEDTLWRVTLAVTNIGDKRYLTSLGSGSSFGVIEGVYGRPREWSLSVKRSF